MAAGPLRSEDDMASKRAEPKEPTELGSRLLRRMAELGMSQNKFEDASSLGRGYSSKLIYGDRGVRMDLVMIVRIARALRVTTDWLLTGAGPKEIPPDPFPNRASAITTLKSVYVDAVIQRLYGDQYNDSGHQTRDWWLAEAERVHGALLADAVRSHTEALALAFEEERALDESRAARTRPAAQERAPKEPPRSRKPARIAG